MDTIAFLGAGLIGAGMVESAQKRGLSTAVWNRTSTKAQALAPLGARVASSVADAVRGASRVHIAVSDDQAVDAVLAEALPALSEGAIVVDHSTTSPAGTKARAERAAREGWGFLHAPVFMSPGMAKTSKGLIVCSGPTATFERARDAIAAMTGDLWYLGERADLAAAYKLFGNAMILTIVGGLADVFAMAKALDVPPALAQEVFTRVKPGGMIEFRGAKMAAGDYTPSFELSMARKDVRLMLEAAGAEPLAVLPGLAARMDALIASGNGAADVSALSIGSVSERSPQAR